MSWSMEKAHVLMSSLSRAAAALAEMVFNDAMIAGPQVSRVGEPRMQRESVCVREETAVVACSLLAMTLLRVVIKSGKILPSSAAKEN
jgi:hypothetical protein